MANVFNKVTGSIDKGIKTVSSKGKELIETKKLKSEIKDVKNSIESRFQSLGKKVFEMLNREALSEDELRLDCKEIASLFRKVTDLENTIRQIELETLKAKYGFDIVICPKCGTPNKSDAKFCMNCGYKIENEKTGGRTCPVCGVHVKEGTKFCPRCGTKIE